FQAEDGIRDFHVTGVQTCALPISTATNSKDPVFEDASIQPGVHINAMGSNVATRRELPADLVRRASVIAVDSLEQARIEAGDLRSEERRVGKEGRTRWGGGG